MKDISTPLSRRRFLAHTSQWAGLCAAAHALPLLAPADDSRVAKTPLLDKGFALVRQIGNGIYATISDPTKGSQTRSNGGFIVGRDAALLMEGFQTPAGASFQMSALRMISQAPVLGALNTHFHFDHTLGNSFYGANQISVWAHIKVAQRMLERYPPWQVESREQFLRPWEERVRHAETDAEREHAKSDIEGLLGMFESVTQSVLSVPNHPLTPAKLPMTVDLGRLRVVIETYAGHTDTDLIVRVPDQNVVFAGDLLMHAHYPTNLDGHPTPWRSTLAKFAQFDRDTLFVPGHGQICGMEGVALMRAIFDDIAGQAEKMYKAGVPVDDAVENYVVPEKWKDFPRFSWGFTIGRTIEQFYSEWQGKQGNILRY